MTSTGDRVDPVDKSRRLANAIAEGMFDGIRIGALAPFVTIPLASEGTARS